MQCTLLTIALVFTAAGTFAAIGLRTNRFHDLPMFVPLLCLTVGALFVAVGVIVNKAGWGKRPD
ncbi:MAG: hypothetical protein ACR2PS_08750 [Pseudomonadales bacterium]